MAQGLFCGAAAAFRTSTCSALIYVSTVVTGNRDKLVQGGDEDLGPALAAKILVVAAPVVLRLGSLLILVIGHALVDHHLNGHQLEVGIGERWPWLLFKW